MGRCSCGDLPSRKACLAELLRVVETMNPRDLARCVHAQGDACYDVLLPEQLTVEWVAAHVQETFIDDQTSLSYLRSSIINDDPAVRLAKTSL